MCYLLHACKYQFCQVLLSYRARPSFPGVNHEVITGNDAFLANFRFPVLPNQGLLFGISVRDINHPASDTKPLQSSRCSLATTPGHCSLSSNYYWLQLFVYPRDSLIHKGSQETWLRTECPDNAAVIYSDRWLCLDRAVVGGFPTLPGGLFCVEASVLSQGGG